MGYCGRGYRTNFFNKDRDIDLSDLNHGAFVKTYRGDDTIVGTDYNDWILSGSGDDVVTGGGGNDVLFGGRGMDTAIFSGSILDYEIFQFGRSKWQMVAGDDGYDFLHRFEALQFDDFMLDQTGNNAVLTVLRSTDMDTDENDAFSFLVDMYDFDGDTPTVVSASVSGGGTVTTSSVSPTQVSGVGESAGVQLDFDPLDAYDYLAVGETATATVTLVVTDGQGGTTTSSYDITVEGQNDAPVATAVAANADENGPAVTVAAEFSDVDSSDTHTYSVDTTGTQGSVTDNGDGTFTYTTNGAFEGLAVGEETTDTFTFTVDDGNGGTSSETITMTVTGENDAPTLSASTAAAVEDGVSVDVDLSALGADVDSDDDGSTLTYTVSGAPSAGTASISGTTLSFAPNADFQDLADGETRDMTIEVTATDAHGATAVNDVVVTVTGTNDAPTLAASTAAATEDGPSVDVDLEALGADVDSDDDGSSLTYAVSGSPSEGTASITGTTLSFAPNADFQDLAVGETRDVTIEVTATDAHGATAVNDVVVTVTGTNDAPTLSASTAAAIEDGPSVDVDLAALGADVDSDDDGSSLTYSVSGAPSEGSASITGTTLNFAPNEDFQDLADGETRDVTIEVTATDAHGATAVNDVVVTVTGTNDAPTLAASTAAATEDGPSVDVDLAALGADVDSDDGGSSLTYSVSGAPSEGSASVTGSTLSFDPSSDFQDLAVGETRDVTIEVTATDAHGASAVNDVVVTVTGTNDAPVANAISGEVGEASQEADADSIGAFTVPNFGRFYIYDFDTGTATSVARDSGANNTYDQVASSYLSNGNGIVVQPNPNNTGWGVAAEVFVDGVSQQVASTDWVITGGNGAVSLADPHVVAFADSNTNIDSMDLYISGLDLGNGTVIDAQISVGPLTYEYTTTDNLRVDGVSFSSVASGASSSVTVTADFSDVDTSDTHTFSIDTTGTQGEVTDNGDGTFSYSANGAFESLSEGETTTDSFTYTVDDGNGGTSTETATITITGANDGPVAMAVTGSAGEDGPAITVTADFTDVDANDTHTFTVDASATAGSVTNNNDGTFSYAANGAFEGLADGATATDSFTYTVDDGNGGTATETATITITGSNDAPTLSASTAAATEDGPSVDVDLSALGGDVDSDDDGSSLTYSVSGAPSEGSASITGATLSFAVGAAFQDLAAGATRNVTIEVTATDAHGATAVNDVVVTVTGTNDAPTVSAIDAGDVTEDDSAQTIDLLAGQSDVDTGAVLSAANISATDDQGDSVSFTDNGDGSISIDPAQFDALDAGESRTVTVSYDVSDGVTSTANTATLTVDGETDLTPPVANDDTLTGSGVDPAITDEDTSHTIAAADLLGNDTDANGDTLNVSAVAALSALGATITLNGDGSVSYDPTTSTSLDEMAEGETLQDSFTYTVSDGAGGTDTATVSLTVSGVDDPPVLSGTTSSQSGFSDDGFSYILPAGLFEDHDEGGAISYSLALDDGSALPSWLDFDGATRELSFAANAPQQSDIGLYTLRVTATEEDGQTNSATFTLSVLDGDLIEGTAGPDSLTGTIQGDLIQGLGGNDRLTGLPGDDVLDGGDGNDQLYGAAGNDVLIGGEGYDNLYGEDGDDVLDGGNGGGNLQGGDGNDEITGGTGNDYINGGYGSDTMSGGEGNDVFQGGYDPDRTSVDEMSGGAGNDTFNQIGYYSSAIIDAGTGDDHVNLYLNGGYSSIPLNSRITLGSGADTVRIQNLSVSQYNQATITDFNTAEDHLDLDYIINTSLTGWDGSTNPFADAAVDPNGGFLRLSQDGANTVLSVDTNGGGDNFIPVITFENTLVSTFTGANFTPAYPPDGSLPAGIDLTGTSSNDLLDGTIGTDTLTGLEGNDTLNGDASPDTLDGGDGTDRLYGGAGDDVLNGGEGYDYLYGEDGDDALNGGDGGGNLQGGDGNDIITGGSGNDNITGGYGADTMIGGDGNDTIRIGYNQDRTSVNEVDAGAGNDIIDQVGYYSNDIVDAGAGDDQVNLLLSGGYSTSQFNTSITLGSGADTVRIQNLTLNPYNQATIADFNTAEDTLDFDYVMDRILTGWDGSTNPFADAAVDPNGGFMRLTQDGANTVLSIDSNGGGDNFVPVITFENTTVASFTSANFFPAYSPDGSLPAGLTLTGTASSDRLDGSVSSDVLIGLGNNDTLNGEASSDTLDGGDGNDWLYGGAANDVLNGGEGYDYLYGEDGDDVLDGGNGGGQLQGGDGDDLITGGTGNDNIYGGYGSDTMIGGDGNDYFQDGYDPDRTSVNEMSGGAGNDTFNQVGYYTNYIVDAGTGDDQVNLYLNGGSSTTPLNAQITLGSGSDTIEIQYSSFNVNNQATVTDFNTAEDHLDLATLINDRLSGWDGVSNPFGSGYMRLIQDGADALLQVDSNGNGDGFVTMITFENNDVADFTDQNFLIDEATSQGYSQDGSGVFGSTTTGSSAAEALAGLFGDDTITGGGGNDTLDGANGADNLDGGTGDDQITGGFGNDVMTGGTGADEFVFNIGEGADVIQDFEVNTDVLLLDGGQSISTFAEVDTDGAGGVDSTLVTFGDDSSVLLENVLGITSELELL